MDKKPPHLDPPNLIGFCSGKNVIATSLRIHVKRRVLGFMHSHSTYECERSTNQTLHPHEPNRHERSTNPQDSKTNCKCEKMRPSVAPSKQSIAPGHKSKNMFGITAATHASGVSSDATSLFELLSIFACRSCCRHFQSCHV